MKKAFKALLILMITVTIGHLLLKKHERNQLKTMFEEDFMRYVPDEILYSKCIDGFDILYQDSATLSERFYYPEHYAIGKKGKKLYGYNYAFTVIGINTFYKLDYIKTVLSYFESDSTHVSTIWRENDNLYCTVNRVHDGEYWPWKTYSLPYLQSSFIEEQSSYEDYWKKN